jgi:alkylglycerol monooxygenase
MNPTIILLAIPFFFLLIGAEWLLMTLRKRKVYVFSDAITNLSIGVGNQAFGLLMKALLAGAYLWAYDNYAIWNQPVAWWSFALCVVVFDFFFYWAHRWSHEINFFWAAHVVHHQSEEYNLSVALRQSWWHNLIAFVIFMPMPFMGFDPLVFFLSAGIHTLYQFWIHTKAIGKLPRWIEYVLNTPSHHRVHHGTNPQYLDKNHAGVFILFDRLFGTFEEEVEEVVYGITTPLESLNPVWANVHYYVELYQKMRQMRRWRDRLRMVWARPGWLPEALGGPQVAATPDPARVHYQPQVTGLFRAYIAAQFVLVLIGLVALMANWSELSLFYRGVCFGMLMLSILICGAMLESKRWVLSAEYVRLALAALALDTLYYFAYLDWFSIMLLASCIGLVVFGIWFTFGWLSERKQSSRLTPANAV